MPVRTAEAEWKGNLTEGSGNLKVGSGAFDGPYSFASRFQDGETSTNPEELLGAAHAGCFTMATDAALTRAGFTPTRLHTTAKVRLDKVNDAFSITKITLELEGEVPDLSREDFEKFAHEAKANCPLSKALTGTEIELIIK
jgi:lipoyl-dependent peroxiredoxin